MYPTAGPRPPLIPPCILILVFIVQIYLQVRRTGQDPLNSGLADAPQPPRRIRATPFARPRGLYEEGLLEHDLLRC